MPFKPSERGDSAGLANKVNLIIRVLQVVFSAVVMGIYANQITNFVWRPIHGKIVLAETVGAISIVTAVIFAAVPFLVSYYYVAIAFAWDWVLFFIWCAVFTTQKKYFGDNRSTDNAKATGVSGVDLIVAAQWIDLTAMLLFLISALMGPVCLLMDRKSLFASRGVEVSLDLTHEVSTDETSRASVTIAWGD